MSQSSRKYPSINDDVKQAWEKLMRGYVMKSMVTSLLHVFQRRVTIQYPTVRKEIPRGYRGTLYLNDDCTGCSLCATICPNKCIDMIEFAAEERPSLPPHLPKQTRIVEIIKKQGKEKKYKIPQVNLWRCMYCGLCEEICPVDVINMSKHYEISERSREALLLTPEHMMAREEVEG